jgi:MinD superfamily P-loop ATPase
VRFLVMAPGASLGAAGGSAHRPGLVATEGTVAHGLLRIAVASGKGGTGKTTVATSLALSLQTSGVSDGLPKSDCVFLDCDAEAPNAHLFLALTFERRQEVVVLIPHVDAAKCTGCGKCAEVCQYHAIVALGKRTLVFSELCHGCGSCTMMCPEGAISEEPHGIGVLEAGLTATGMAFARGMLNVGEPMAAQVIRQLKRWILSSSDAAGKVAILDAPPGTSCPVVEAMRGADYLLLVTEPTPFGLHDLRLAAEVAADLGIPAGVIINRDGIGDAGVDEFCAAEGLPILLCIPFERAIAEGNAQGRTLVDIHPEYASRFRAMVQQIAELVRQDSACHATR